MCLVLSSAALPVVVNAQAGAAPATAPVVLPLSGRTGEPGAVASVLNLLPGGAQTVSTISSTVEVQGAYQGSVPTPGTPGAPLALTLAEAVRRGLEYNLGTVGYQNATRQARAQRQEALSVLLPNLSAYALVTEQQVDLAAFGFSFQVPGFSIPTVVGPFHYTDVRAQLTQNVWNQTARRNFEASQQTVKATKFSAQDARGLSQNRFGPRPGGLSAGALSTGCRPAQRRCGRAH
jgi:hypothetical protein